MAINTFPAVASPVKSVQRGSAAGAGTVTITSVDISKSFVNIQGTIGSGTVAATGAVAGITGNIASANVAHFNNYASTFRYGNNGLSGYQIGRVAATTFTGNASNISGGTNNLVAGQIQGYLSNATSLVVSGACRWEVVEYN